jgi:hypothetical protein
MVDKDEGNAEVVTLEEKSRSMETRRKFVFNISYTKQTK